MVLGSTTVLLQAVENVDTGDLTDVGGGQRVVVRRGGAWTVTGVLGSTEDAATVARRVARDGLAAVTGKILATSGSGTTLTWEDARLPGRDVRPDVRPVPPEGARDDRRGPLPDLLPPHPHAAGR